MLLVGLTGGIGAGKSVCARLFELLDVPIYSSDDRAKRLMIENESLVNSIQELFGPESYLEDGRLNKAHLAGIIFTDPEKLKAMNGLVHPAVRQDFQEWAFSFSDHAYVLQESALLFETRSYRSFDRTILVTAPLEIRISRVMARDGVDRQSVLNRIDRQMPDARKKNSVISKF